MANCIIIKNKYHFVSGFYNGLTRVQLNDKWGFIDKTGNEVIECKYDMTYSFKKGFFYVKLNHEWFYVNKNETIKIKIMKLS